MTVRLDDAVAAANLPALVMVLFQLTGDHRWLADPFRPTRPRGLEEHDDGGFPPEVAEEIRSEAVRALQESFAGAPAAVPCPSGALLGEMFSAFVGEDVPEEYWVVASEFMGFTPMADPRLEPEDAADLEVLVIGAGVSGLLAAARLGRAGIRYTVVDRADEVGGVWRQNAYPGAGVDTPSVLYTFGEQPQAWSTTFARQPEVLRYLEDFATTHDLGSSIELRTEVVEARWDEESRCWRVTLRGADGDERYRTVAAIISAVGLFTEPAVPDIAGLDRFDGPVFHSSRWPGSLDVTGRRVAVVGTGASAMQIVPAIADIAEHVDVYQRTAQWIAPVPHYFNPIADETNWLLDRVPFYRGWCRTRLAWTFFDKLAPAMRIDPEWEHPERSVNRLNDNHRRFYTAYAEEKLAGRPDLLAKSIPAYPPYGKRLLLDNGWFDALLKPGVELITEPIEAVTPTGIRAASEERQADVVVLSTGFQTSRYLFPMAIVGRDGADLRATWNDDDATAYLGVMTPGFPNLFFMYGPGTNAGGGSYIQLAELQIGYIVQLIAELARRRSRAVEPRQDAHDDYNRRFDAANAEMVWSHPGMTTYVRNSKGRVTVNMPWRIVDYWHLMSQPDTDDFDFS